LSNGSRRILETLGVWAAVSDAATPIRKIHVSDQGRFGFARVDAAEQGLTAMGYVVPNRSLGTALWTRLSRSESLRVFCPAHVTRVGLDRGNDWRAQGVELDESGVSFQVDTGETAFEGEYRVNLLGRHQVTNALLALAVGAAMGLTRVEMQRGLAGCQAARMRLQVWLAKGVRVLDDAYNANADSVLAALNTLKEFPCTGRRIAVLGDMSELGTHSADAHAEVGRHAAELELDQLFAVGRMAGVMGAAARAAGLTSVNELGEVETAASTIRRFVRDGDVVLLKASRAARLERVGEELRNRERS
jgi:UDP-N-acetylmuramoyl-tripeptide--D-alanyl-D-alanine ligase